LMLAASASTQVRILFVFTRDFKKQM